MTKRITICAGIDTGKHKLDVAIDGHREQTQVENAAAGHEALVAWLRDHRVKRVAVKSAAIAEVSISL